jgi:hypothetical protein
LIIVKEPFCADTYAEAAQIIELLNMIKQKQVEAFKRSVVEMYAPKSPSPPAEMPKTPKDDRPMECDTCEMGDAENWPCQWFNQDKKKCTHPDEMPEVDLTPMRMEAHQEEPMVMGRCLIYKQELGDKKAGSCVGCKIAGCSMSGRVTT